MTQRSQKPPRLKRCTVCGVETDMPFHTCNRSAQPTNSPYAVLCPSHGRVFLTQEQFDAQMERADDRWLCPTCNAVSEWDDETFEKRMEGRRG